MSVPSPRTRRNMMLRRHQVQQSRFSLVPKKKLERRNTSSNMPEMVIRSIFDKYSSDGNVILKQELRVAAYDMGYFLDDDELNIGWSILDRNGDGIVTFPEFLTWWRKEKKFEKLASLEDDRMKEAVQYFTYFDTDRSGAIGKDEFAALYVDLRRNGYVRDADDVEEAWAEVSNDTENVLFNDFIVWIGFFNPDTLEINIINGQ
eukprot:TRINITY_DN11290_c0_g1_i1.p1 TRINITY_DN11290_c0_g1~~TRINITY_DN11290_c0_g1_i1.p1  ORF type:complete len:211 (-),score=44.23 TRINITY_DN11290_c0_g1_i1:36-647(-)